MHMDVFKLRNSLTHEYATYVKSFVRIRDSRIRHTVESAMNDGLLWPEPLIQMNPSFSPGRSIDRLISDGLLHPKCAEVFRVSKSETSTGRPLQLHKHQDEAIEAARSGANYVLTTGTGSGKSLSYIIPIVDHVLRNGSGRGVKAIVVYPMNALANSQEAELRKFIDAAPVGHTGTVRFARYTGQESDEQRVAIKQAPPDILLTNYVMLELLLTRVSDDWLVGAARDLRFLILDELHTYRGRQGADVAMLIRRTRERLEADRLQMIGTSATMASGGGREHQQRVVASVASRLFGSVVEPKHVIGETLRRVTPSVDFALPNNRQALVDRLQRGDAAVPQNFTELEADPLCAWLESALGVKEDESGRLCRVQPRRIGGKDGIAAQLTDLTGVAPLDETIRQTLLAAYRCGAAQDAKSRAFAFRLHQFFSRGDTVYATLEPESIREITVHGQKFKPGNRELIFLPMVFCRECGEAYYCVWQQESSDGSVVFAKRELNDTLSANDEEESTPGFLRICDDPKSQWPDTSEGCVDLLPEDWKEIRSGREQIKQGRKRFVPRTVEINGLGQLKPGGLRAVFIPSPFRFCMCCGVAYGGGRLGRDFARLSTLGTEGRSTSTTILSLSAVSSLRADPQLPQEARKLLSFTDNRQDASLQAGHFNDFIEVGLLRTGLRKALELAGPVGIGHEELTQRVFDSIDLPFDTYAVDPSLRGLARTETQKVLRQVLGYRAYLDLRRGWRVTSPNLEQCGLLRIEYSDLDRWCASTDADVWQDKHEALRTATPHQRQAVVTALLDFMRRELAIKVESLDARRQESMQQQSRQRLIAPWSIDEGERLIHAPVLKPRSRRGGSDYRGYVYLSEFGVFGQFLRRRDSFPNHPSQLDRPETKRIIGDLLNALSTGGYVERVEEPQTDDDVPGYQLPAAAMRWIAGSGDSPVEDRVRVPEQPANGRAVNPFFRGFYTAGAERLKQMQAREHTAQVPSPLRIERERDFGEAKLPVLFCSPTMELGVDIRQLNVVSMRNVPPTPANYAQRSGRAGRSGQPALVFTYCSTGSSHDQWFFKRPEQMVAGAVEPPRIDLANEDLIRAHVYAVWLAECKMDLHQSLSHVLDVAGSPPSLAILPSKRDCLDDQKARLRTVERVRRMLSGIQDELQQSGWYSEQWLERTLQQVGNRFEQACERWRGLYRAALRQFDASAKIMKEAGHSVRDKSRAEQLFREAKSQLQLLQDTQGMLQADFYSYRYFASEGFLPGYSFPRLPIAAYVPGQRSRDEYLQRPRFLAISEFGPRAILYHEGSQYEIHRAILPIRDEIVESFELPLRSVKVCASCGYIHDTTTADADLCDHCSKKLPARWSSLFQLQNVATRRRERISSDEEERKKLGYEVRTAIRFKHREGSTNSESAEACDSEGQILALDYGHAADVWRINLGWARRKAETPEGFVIDLDNGQWQRSDVLPAEVAAEDADDGDGTPSVVEEDDPAKRARRVIPFVRDAKLSGHSSVYATARSGVGITSSRIEDSNSNCLPT
jgi:ATP-dependent helicase YprA (DUF1998 family)